MKHTIVLLIALKVSFFVKAQKNSEKIIIPSGGTITVRDIKQDFYPELMRIEKPMPGGIPNKFENTHQKKDLSIRAATNPQNNTLTDVGLGIDFNANSFSNATPCDNDIAISDSNIIVSVINSTIAFYDVNATPVTLGVSSVAAFFSSLGLPNNEFDPKVVYDPEQDKYVLLCLNGFTDTTSNILVGFSQSNDPMGVWNLYSIPGNPKNNGLWTDYPMLALTQKELFITVNLLYPDSTWQTGFNETIIWQINKFNGYNNLPLNAYLIDSIQFNGRNIRNICPVKGGSQLYGPDMYFVSNRNFETQGDTVFLIHVSDTAGASGYNVTVQQLNSDADYFFAGDARQTGIHKLATNDSRTLGAFIENGIIQYVHNSMDTATTFCGIYHGIISNLTTIPTVQGQQISDTLRDIGYPNISYAGNGVSDNTAIISFDHTAPSVYAGVSAIKTDGGGNYSYIKRIKDGSSYVNVLSGATERWGDYSGSQRKYNGVGEVWSAGYLGYASGVNRVHRAYIAQLFVDQPLSVNEFNNVQWTNANVYPNPFENFVSVEFDLKEAKYMEFDLHDINGKRIVLLMRERVKAGKNNFSFTVQDLPAGIYIFTGTSGNETIVTKKIVRDN